MKTVTVDDLLQCYVRDNNCRDIMHARKALECAALEARAHWDEQTRAKGLLLLEGLQEWDEQQKAKQQANTQTPPPKHTYNAQQTNSASQAPPQTNTAQALTNDYTILYAFTHLAFGAIALFSIFAGLYALGGVIVSAIHGAADGIAAAAAPIGKGIIYVGACGIGLLGLKEFFTTKEIPTVPNGTTGYTINHYHYGNGTVKTEQK
jgi:hypothetical protein